MLMTKTTWKDHDQYNFTVGGRESFVVCPKNPLLDRPWAWRTEFFGAFDSVDLALLRGGWHLAYHRASDQYGCPQSIAWLHEFQTVAEAEFKLAPRAVLFGFSRGGLYAFNYARAYPDQVALLYLDAPVLDIRSWPGGQGRGDGHPACWQQCLACYNLTEENAAGFRDGPLDHAAEVARAGIPIIVVAGDADTAVPWPENGARLQPLYAEAGGNIRVILKPGVGHHPHSLENPAPVVDFITEFRRH